jgi:hypothetical protein
MDIKILKGQVWLPVGFVIAITGFIFWMSNVALQAQVANSSIDEIKEQLKNDDDKLVVQTERLNSVLREISDRLGRLEGILEKK